MNNLVFFNTEFETENFQFCKSKELRFFNLFYPQNEYFRFGWLIFVSGQLIGVVKNKGEKNMLSLKTDSNQVPLLKNRIYILPKKIIELIRKYETKKNKEWNYINFEVLYLKDSKINLENYEKIKDVYGDKSGFERVLQNNIDFEFELWQYRKKFDLEISKEFWK